MDYKKLFFSQAKQNFWFNRWWLSEVTDEFLNWWLNYYGIEETCDDWEEYFLRCGFALQGWFGARGRLTGATYEQSRQEN